MALVIALLSSKEVSGSVNSNNQWKKEQVFNNVVVAVVQLIHRLTQADISCTTSARLFFFPLLGEQEPNTIFYLCR